MAYDPISRIDDGKIIKAQWLQNGVHDVPCVVFLIHLLRFVQGRGRTSYCGPQTLINRWETGFASGPVIAKQIGANCPFRFGNHIRSIPAAQSCQN